MNNEEKLDKLKYMFALAGKKFPGDEAAIAMIKRLDRMGLVSQVMAHVLAVAIYGAAGCLAAKVLGLPNALGGGLAFIVIRLALNFSPTAEDAHTKVQLERKILGKALADAPTDPAILAELLGNSQFGNPDHTPKA